MKTSPVATTCLAKLLVLACLTTVALAGCTNGQPVLRCDRLTTTTEQNRTLQLAFRRDAAPQTITVQLAWAAPGAPFYTRYGPLQSVTLTEGALTVAVPPERVRHIEDIWPEHIALFSPRLGSYDLVLPAGVPIAVPQTITIRSGKFVRVRTGGLADP